MFSRGRAWAGRGRGGEGAPPRARSGGAHAVARAGGDAVLVRRHVFRARGALAEEGGAPVTWSRIIMATVPGSEAENSEEATVRERAGASERCCAPEPGGLLRAGGGSL
jgi:hypothetical protein